MASLPEAPRLELEISTLHRSLQSEGKPLVWRFSTTEHRQVTPQEEKNAHAGVIVQDDEKACAYGYQRTAEPNRWEVSPDLGDHEPRNNGEHGRYEGVRKRSGSRG